MFANQRNYPNGFYILALLETRVEYDADMIEELEVKRLHN